MIFFANYGFTTRAWLVKSEKHNGTCKLYFEGDIGINHAWDMLAAINDAVRSSSTIEVYLTNVKELKWIGVQLLVYGVRLSKKSKKSFRLMKPSTTVHKVLGDHSLLGFFGLKDTMAVEQWRG
jgi:ABC-type transporter Mla MlaB component